MAEAHTRTDQLPDPADGDVAGRLAEFAPDWLGTAVGRAVSPVLDEQPAHGGATADRSPVPLERGARSVSDLEPDRPDDTAVAFPRPLAPWVLAAAGGRPADEQYFSQELAS